MAMSSYMSIELDMYVRPGIGTVLFLMHPIAPGPWLSVNPVDCLIGGMRSVVHSVDLLVGGSRSVVDPVDLLVGGPRTSVHSLDLPSRGSRSHVTALERAIL